MLSLKESALSLRRVSKFCALSLNLFTQPLAEGKKYGYLCLIQLAYV